MAHIHTGPGQYDLTSSAFIVGSGEEPALLLHRHKTLDVLIQPGGHVELTETPWQAITREILEETGYEVSQLRILQPRVRPPGTGVHPQPVCVRSFRFGEEDHFHTDVTYAFVTDELPRHPVGADESQDLIWVTRALLASLAPPETYDDVREVGLFVLDHLLSTLEPIPPPSSCAERSGDVVCHGGVSWGRVN